jgi:hypothetical protein
MMMIAFAVFGTLTLRERGLTIDGFRLCDWKFAVGAMLSLITGMFFGPY